ncbi:unnamed protein product [Arabidopsis lyrata]|uniref:F-box domain-containing protein n=1 Tax=Arabidopsis lyrata subsp. lyrata TaxID=81972 RepID=D7LPR5_ARALL|nr:putative F-box protein At3g28280 [Arabidopsis lyrata subsp. lyrata]EFH53353.1 hypothetical protein ARALYDRAFT_905087 [Arabidopsis lyrata subsp. lyrata]CAH8267033.1 unnamed protein product [Arabidopsis lyrata]|eukprot:XP_002877094.1 putative F-box protein At3g28280 [Arabidopsis lyrata subsp. lyrata]
MNSLPEDILAIIFAKLPIKIFTTFKLVCKQWESIVESPYFRDLFLSMHQTSHSSSWSLLSCCFDKEVIANYECNTWGLERSLGSYISSFVTKKFETLRNKYKVWAHSTDVGLILISELFFNMKNRSLYVANPVSQECVEIPSHHAHRSEYFYPLGIATRSENGFLLDYKVVLFDTHKSLLIYSSKTGLWSLNTVDLSVSCIDLRSTICLHGSIHLIATTSHGEDVVVSFNLYATGTSSVQCRVTSFPDFGQHRPNRSFSTWQGSIMYMNIISVTKDDGSLEDKLFVWRLENGEWQLVFEIATPFIETRVEYFPLAINPFDAKTVYFWSKKHRSFISINLNNGKFVLESKLEDNITRGLYLRLVVLPQWLHRIPNTVRMV